MGWPLCPSLRKQQQKTTGATAGQEFLPGCLLTGPASTASQNSHALHRRNTLKSDPRVSFTVMAQVPWVPEAPCFHYTSPFALWQHEAMKLTSAPQQPCFVFGRTRPQPSDEKIHVASSLFVTDKNTNQEHFHAFNRFCFLFFKSSFSTNHFRLLHGPSVHNISFHTWVSNPGYHFLPNQ